MPLWATSGGSAQTLDAILDGQWQAASDLGASAFPVLQETDGHKWAPHDWKILQQAKNTVSQYGVKSEASRQIVIWIFSADLLCPADCRNLMSLLLSPTQYLLWGSLWTQRATNAAAQHQQLGDPLYGTTSEMLIGGGQYADVNVQLTSAAAVQRPKLPASASPFKGNCYRCGEGGQNY